MTPSSTTSSSSISREFNPPDVVRKGDGAGGLGDQRSGSLYVYSPRVKLAVRVALVTGRPLLVRGPPGWGKSSLARAVANFLGWRYLEKVISSRTQARDLMSELDLVRRLSDAQAEEGGVDTDWRRYIRPGVLWKAFNPGSAERQQRFFDRVETAADKAGTDDMAPFRPAVVLLDEMDKADPDVPNNLLVALGSLQFTVDEIIVNKDGETAPLLVETHRQAEPLIIVTTNDERDLPRAFLRRCVEIALPALEGKEDEEEKDKDKDGKQRIELLVKIGLEHLKGESDKAEHPLDEKYVRGIATIIAQQKKGEDGLIIPSPAEFIDTLRAVAELYGSQAAQEDVKQVVSIAVRKRGAGVA